MRHTHMGGWGLPVVGESHYIGPYYTPWVLSWEAEERHIRRLFHTPSPTTHWGTPGWAHNATPLPSTVGWRWDGGGDGRQ